MEIQVIRKHKTDTYTIGDMLIDGEWVCNTIEDKDRDLDNSMTPAFIRTVKVAGSTAIPRGTYDVSLAFVSPKYSSSSFYQEVCSAKVPRLMYVPGYEGVLIHAGNTAQDTEGCVLVGMNTKKGMVTNSRKTFRKVYELMKQANERKEKITITVL